MSSFLKIPVDFERVDYVKTVYLQDESMESKERRKRR